MTKFETETQTKTKGKGDCQCKSESCPTCSSVECFERPRYFCGQLLTDKDLDAAQRYVIEKNKLHNRYVVGDGVVCGLAVRCDACDNDTVTIEPGYAIDCCGNDIVLCVRDRFNLREYLDACLKPKSECDDKIEPSGCDDIETEYCIFLSYAEENSRPITAMVRNGSCSTTRCEPSRTKESHCFSLIEKSKLEDAGDQSIWSHIKECWTVMEKDVQAIFKEFETLTAMKYTTSYAYHTKAYNLFCKIRVLVLDLYRNGPNIRCSLTDELERIEKYFPSFEMSEAEPAKYKQQLTYTLILAMAFLVDFFIDCFCDALLTPCRPCREPHGVLLACVTMKNDKVQSICNIVRRQVITGPMVRYWAQPLFSYAHRGLEWLCCDLDVVHWLEGLLKMTTVEPQDLNAGAAQAKSVYGVGKEFGMNAFTKLKQSIPVAAVFNKDKVTAFQVLGKPVAEVRRNLAKRYEVVETTMPTKDAAYDFAHLTHMSWVVPESARKVELMVDPDTKKVTCIRVLDRETAKEEEHDH